MRVDRTSTPVAPIFQLLGEGQLGPEGVEAVMAVLDAEGLPPVAQSRLVQACLVARRPRPVPSLDVAAVVERGVRRLLATLVVDLNLRARPAGLRTAGLRGAGLTGCRLLFTADGYEVVIQESAHARRVGRNVIGQVLRDGDPVPSATVLLAGTSRHEEAAVDEEGSFRFQNVPGGSYELDVWAGDDLIVCTPVMLDDR